MEKMCTKCGVKKNIDSFYSNSKPSNVKISICKQCKRIENRRWKMLNKGASKKHKQTYRLKHGKEKISVSKIIDMEENNDPTILYLCSDTIGDVRGTAKEIIKKVISIASEIKTEQIKWKRGPRLQTNLYRQVKVFFTHYEKAEYIWSQFSNVEN